jgi:Na+/melibiose symporter-like transporter
MPKLALAMASGFAFLILGSVNFMPGSANPDQTLFWLAFLYAMLPSIIKALAGLSLYYAFKLKGDHHEHFQRSHSDGINHVN